MTLNEKAKEAGLLSYRDYIIATYSFIKDSLNLAPMITPCQECDYSIKLLRLRNEDGNINIPIGTKDAPSGVSVAPEDMWCCFMIGEDMAFWKATSIKAYLKENAGKLLRESPQGISSFMIPETTFIS
jgi:hypothetical protein